ncbi:glycosyltransferase family 4 protein, partial [Planktotalea sp.]|uniref:glycosyltransferase family 4 protein n=1 Tax=Planktotalea sp. TaxID=2029877 RepID=UPI003299B42D
RFSPSSNPMLDRPLKIAYLCDITPLDPNLYSGGNARMYQALQEHAGEVTILSNSWHLAEPLRRLMHALPEALNLRMRWRLHLLLGRIIARGVRRELKRGDYDVLFCAYSIQSLAGLGAVDDLVIGFTTDATPTTYKRSVVGQSFGSFLSASRYLDPWIARQEQRVLSSTELLLLPTEWLRDGIAETFEGLEGRMHIIPWGANIDAIEKPKVSNALRVDRPIELIFVGRDWHAKGGPLALGVLNTLLERGRNARLTILGCKPEGMTSNETLNIVGPLDKSDPAELAKFAQCFQNAHFLINPSFESYGFAYCEAAAYGLPALSLRVGGVPVREGINGHALPVTSEATDFSDVIDIYVEDPKKHEALRISSRKEYEERLNWDAWGKAVANQLRRAVDAPR